MASTQREIKSTETLALWAPCLQPSSWHALQKAQAGWRAHCTEGGYKPRTLCSVSNQIPVSGKFLNSKSLHRMVLSKYLQLVKFRVWNKSSLIIRSGSGPATSFRWKNRMHFHSLGASSQCWLRGRPQASLLVLALRGLGHNETSSFQCVPGC